MATRLNININDQTADTLKREAAVADTSVTEVVRRAAGVYDYLIRAQREGRDIEIVERNGDHTRLVLL